MKYYPVFIPTLNRFDHFKSCIESLSKCTHADKTELVIGLDYPPAEKYAEGHQLIKNYLPTIKGFGTITIFEHKENLGPEGNWEYLVNYCKSHYDAYIATEDDNVFSPAFLDFMDKALERFHDDENILTVSGYNPPDAYDQGSYTSYLSKDNCAWGIGLWVHKEEKLHRTLNDTSFFKHIIHSRSQGKLIYEAYPILYKALDSMVKENANWGDSKRTAINILWKKYQLKPAISLVRNCGYDGSGVHCGNNTNGLNTQKISEALQFDFGEDIGPSDTETNKKSLYYHGLPTDSEKKAKLLNYISHIYKSKTNVFWRIRQLYSKYRIYIKK